MTRLVIAAIKKYQSINAALVAVGFPLVSFSGCRSWPTCSEYAISAIERHGVLRGGARAAVRFLKCNPLFAPHQPVAL